MELPTQSFQYSKCFMSDRAAKTFAAAFLGSMATIEYRHTGVCGMLTIFADITESDKYSHVLAI
jgi:hypothetical protein